MNDGVKLYKDKILPEFENYLTRFQEDVHSQLENIQYKLQRIFSGLEQREYSAQQEIEIQQNRVYGINSRLGSCYRVEQADCRPYEESLNQAYRALQKAEERYHLIQNAQERLRYSQESYQHRAYLLQQYLANELPKAKSFLHQKSIDIDNYLTVPTPQQSYSFSDVKNEAYNAFRETTNNKNPYKMQGEAGEMIATLNGNRSSLDKISPYLISVKHGACFTLYDNLSESGKLGSVKTYGIQRTDEPLSEKQKKQALYGYMRAFKEAIGKGKSEKKLRDAATLLLESKQKKFITPPPLMKAVTTVEEMMDYLREHGELQIPSDQVEWVQNNIRKKYNYLKESECEKLAQRVVSLPATTEVIGDMMKNYKKTRRNLNQLKNNIR